MANSDCHPSSFQIVVPWRDLIDVTKLIKYLRFNMKLEGAVFRCFSWYSRIIFQNDQNSFSNCLKYYIRTKLKELVGRCQVSRKHRLTCLEQEKFTWQLSRQFSSLIVLLLCLLLLCFFFFLKTAWVHDHVGIFLDGFVLLFFSNELMRFFIISRVFTGFPLRLTNLIHMVFKGPKFNIVLFFLTISTIIKRR